MKLPILALVLAAAAQNVAAAVALAAAPGIEAKPLQLRPKAALALAEPRGYAPFVARSAPGPDLNLTAHRDEHAQLSRSSCEVDRALCYDPGSGHIVYKPARQLMPEIPGLQRENISVRRDRIVLRYSF